MVASSCFHFLCKRPTFQLSCPGLAWSAGFTIDLVSQGCYLAMFEAQVGSKFCEVMYVEGRIRYLFWPSQEFRRCHIGCPDEVLSSLVLLSKLYFNDGKSWEIIYDDHHAFSCGVWTTKVDANFSPGTAGQVGHSERLDRLPLRRGTGFLADYYNVYFIILGIFVLVIND